MIVMERHKRVWKIEDHFGRIDFYNRRKALAKMAELLMCYDNFTWSEARQTSEYYVNRGHCIIDSGCEVIE